MEHPESYNIVDLGYFFMTLKESNMNFHPCERMEKKTTKNSEGVEYFTTQEFNPFKVEQYSHHFPCVHTQGYSYSTPSEL